MARAKSTSGSKTTTNTSKEQSSAVTPANVPDVSASVPAGLQANVQANAQVNTQPKAQAAAPVESKPAAKIAPEPRKKLEVVKTDARRVIPINLEDEIRRRAYELYLQRGTNSGSEAEDWLTAEREVRQRYHQQQSA
ncbi:MAG: DUF2934 domain-containing protein [Candidatus Sulfotelmatobacter sp.]|jgi:hypothetical protein